MSQSRKEIIEAIERQRKTIRDHIDKYNKFKANDDHTSSAIVTIENSQALIANLMRKINNFPSSYEDSWSPPR